MTEDVKSNSRREEYREVYLRSDHWQRMRALALEDAEHRCAVCNRAKDLDVHHRTYERLGNERLTDLLVLCRHCHTIFHENGRISGPQKSKKKQKPKKEAVNFGPENERLHAVQQRNKQQQRAIREGTISPVLLAELANRYRR